MDAAVSEWLNLGLRWAHVIAGIMWIGDSLLFLWLDDHLHRPQVRDDKFHGELWMVHGGGFYHLQKRSLAPNELPPVLHWFKWEATATWLTGFCLLWLVYYLGGVLVDPYQGPVTNATGIAIGLSFFIISWAMYDTLLRLKLPALAVSGLFLLLFAVAAYLLAQVFTGRAMFLHMGAMLGTLMVANVWMRILPAQRQLLAATRAGKAQDTQLALRAKTRSRHNTYMTYPVILTMVSNHFPTLYGHELNWFVICLFFALGAAARHAMIAKRQTPLWVCGVMVTALGGIFYLLA